MTTRLSDIVPALALACSAVTAGIGAQAKPLLAAADYARFESLGDVALSPDGNWLVHTVSRTNAAASDTFSLHLRSTGREATRVIPWARAPRFSADSKWLAWRGDKDTTVVLLELGSGEERTFERVHDHVFDAAGRYIALHGDASLRIVDLIAGDEVAFGSVERFAWSDARSQLAMVVGAPPRTHLQLFDASTGRIRALDLGDAAFGDSLGVSATMTPRWSPNGTRIAFGIRPLVLAQRDSSGVQIWHAADHLIVPQQRAAAAARGDRSRLAIWDVERDTVRRVGTTFDGESELIGAWDFAVERDATPYPFGARYGRPFHDVWSVRTSTGERRLIADGVRYSFASAAGRYILTFDGAEYVAHDLTTGSHRILTAGIIGDSFADTAVALPGEIAPPYGIGGWLERDAAVLLHSRYDVWRVPMDGSAPTRLTNGGPDRLVHRVVDVDGRAGGSSASRPIHVALHGERTQQRGYGRVLPSGKYERLLLLDKRVSGLAKAAAAERFVYRVEARDDSPDLFVASGRLGDGVQVTATNRFLEGYAWTRSELVSYREESGRELQGVLLYPANHEPGRTYPMLVFAYELLSSRLHDFQAASERSPYNFSAWTQQGYFVLLPDVVLRPRDPGISVMETVDAAIGEVTARGLVDPRRIGFIGHSLGGYHAAFLATHATRFAAVVAGAPITDLVSGMGQIHWGDGYPELDHWETGQLKMMVPYWEDTAAHHRNSPIHAVQTMTTPLLIAFGDADGVIDWHQGVELYNYARRAGKQVVMLVYEGEGHQLSRPPNQVDYHRRILEWFGHYLKDEPAPSWIARGVPLEAVGEDVRRLRR